MTDRLISCDDHMDHSQLPANLWTTGLPASLLDRAPHVEERDGQAVWVWDGKVCGRWDGNPSATGSARPIRARYNAFHHAGIHDVGASPSAVAELRLSDTDRGIAGKRRGSAEVEFSDTGLTLSMGQPRYRHARPGAPSLENPAAVKVVGERT
jgi:hypothetical protein